MSVDEWIKLAIAVPAGLIFLACVLVCVPLLPSWFRANRAGLNVDFPKLVAIRLRRVDVSAIVRARVEAQRAHLKVTWDQLETHDLAGGNVDQLVEGMIAAKQAGVPIGFETASAIERAGEDIVGEARRLSRGASRQRPEVG